MFYDMSIAWEYRRCTRKPLQIFKQAQGSNKLLSPLLRVVIRPSFPAILKFCLLQHLFVVYTQTFLVQSEFLLGKKTCVLSPRANGNLAEDEYEGLCDSTVCGSSGGQPRLSCDGGINWLTTG
jgi:hypothetical protein